MGATVKEIEISAPPEKVFDYIADLPKHGEWGQHNVEIKAVSPGPVAVGSTYEHEGHQMGAHHDRLTVTEYAPPRRFGFESTGDAGPVRHILEVTPAGGGSRLTKSMEIIKPSFVTRLMTPFIMIA